MLEWITANWIWILLALGVGWLLFRSGGMGCGMGGHRHPQDGHGRHHGDHGEPDAADPAAGRRPATSARRSRHGGCC